MKQMRKANRQKDAQWALEVFDKAPYITVSMTRPDGTPYGLPLNVVRKDETTFYFHCASEGEKIDCLKHNPIVSLSAVSRCSPKYEEDKNNFTEYYNSAIAIGKAEFVTDDPEKIEALRLLCERFLPKYMEHFDDAIARSLDRTTIVRITLTELPVGKAKP
ncbi:MAG: pyridoxamine 5'-phosphate oxidase family protein [Muribaculum sp.]|nr:pyridoxamine 5'-phosphate oxidase family protein [Muribaculum sp.]